MGIFKKGQFKPVTLEDLVLEEERCPICNGLGYVPEGACTPYGPERFEPCSCNKEYEEYLQNL